VPPSLISAVLEIVSLGLLAIPFPVVVGLVPQVQLAFLLFSETLMWCPWLLWPPPVVVVLPRGEACLLSPVLVAVATI